MVAEISEANRVTTKSESARAQSKRLKEMAFSSVRSINPFASILFHLSSYCSCSTTWIQYLVSQQLSPFVGTHKIQAWKRDRRRFILTLRNGSSTQNSNLTCIVKIQEERINVERRMMLSFPLLRYLHTYLPPFELTLPLNPSCRSSCAQ